MSNFQKLKKLSPDFIDILYNKLYHSLKGNWILKEKLVREKRL